MHGLRCQDRIMSAASEAGLGGQLYQRPTTGPEVSTSRDC